MTVVCKLISRMCSFGSKAIPVKKNRFSARVEKINLDVSQMRDKRDVDAGHILLN